MRLTKFTFPIFFLIFFACKTDSTTTKTTSINAHGNQMAVQWELIKNEADDKGTIRQQAVFTLQNDANIALTNNWILYFNQINGPISGKTETGKTTLQHINGDFYSLKPQSDFLLQPGEKVAINFQAKDWSIKSSDAPAGLYAVYSNENGQMGEPIPVKNYTIVPFASKEQLTRAPGDKFPIPTNQSRFDENAKLTKLSSSDLAPVLPTPSKVLNGQGSLRLDPNFTICYMGDYKAEAEFLSSSIQQFGINLKTYDGGACNTQTIRLSTVSTPIAGQSKEAYRLKISPEKELISIEGTDAAGIFYGIQSLLALITTDQLAGKQTELNFSALTIEDAPRFPYRGLMLDVSRNFHSKKLVKKLLDLMATYKLNKFHFHLTDDEGWRIAINGLPELTDIGAKRGHTLDEKDRLQPAYGSGPVVTDDDLGGSGYYTRADYIEIIKHAKARHIEVIPEIDLPGHARSAIVPMKVRYEKLMAAGENEAAIEYLLHDPEDQSEYRSVQSYNDNVINVCQASTYRFISKVVDELMEMHQAAGAPLKIVHTGGDEVPGGVWQKSPQCAELLKANPNLEGSKIGLTTHFLKNFNQILEERGLVTAGWEEIGLELAHHGAPRKPNPAFVNKNFLPYVWNSVLGWGGEDLAYQLANMGYKIVLCNASNLYFDMAYDKDPHNPGLYWAGFVNTRTVYDFAPFDLIKTAKMGRFGETLNPDELAKGKIPLNPKAKENIVGIQGQLWSETMLRPEFIEQATFPKLMALAERAWAAERNWESIVNKNQRFAQLDQDWNRFSNVIGQREMTRLDYLNGGVNYYIPVPGAKIEQGKLHANTAFPGLIIRYTVDGSEPNKQSPIYTAPISVNGDVRIKAFSQGGNSSRSTLVKLDLVN